MTMRGTSDSDTRPRGCPGCGSDDQPAQVDNGWYCRDCGDTWRDVGAASGRAIDAAEKVIASVWTGEWPKLAFAVLEAAHDPALGLDRSVRLGDVLGALRPDGWASSFWQFADDNEDAAAYIARKFGVDQRGSEGRL